MTSKTNTFEHKATYVAPQLTEFGSVRNLTGGSGSQGADAINTSMTMMD